MRLPDMRAKVRGELAHIPDWPQPQGELRMVYWSKRMASLGAKHREKGTPLEILRRCIAQLEPDHAGHRFEYDEHYFELISK
jgi:hypothetical protein